MWTIWDPVVSHNVNELSMHLPCEKPQADQQFGIGHHPSHLLLCALLTCSTPKSALWNSQIPGCESSIQCPVTAKYLSIFDTFHASHVMLTSPWTNFLYKMSMVTDARPVKMARVSLKIPWDRLTDSWTCSLSLPNLPSDLALWHHWWHMLQFQSWY